MVEVSARLQKRLVIHSQDFSNTLRGWVGQSLNEADIAALLKMAGLAASSGEGNRLIDGGGVRLDTGVVSDKGLKLGAGTYVLQVGKRKFARVTLV